MTTVISHTELYAEVQQFYAEQMQSLDRRDFIAFAETFVEDAELSHTGGRPPARTRAGIVSDLMDIHKDFEAERKQRRHWFNQMNLKPQDDGTIVSTVYGIVYQIRAGADLEIELSCVVNDVLVRVNGELRTRSRQVEHD